MHGKPFRAAKELVQPFSLSFTARLCFPYLRDVATPGNGGRHSSDSGEVPYYIIIYDFKNIVTYCDQMLLHLT